MRLIARVKAWVARILVEIHVLWLAARDRRTPWVLRLGCFLVAAYALSPVDLIPDVIPVIGLLDDLLLVPLGAALCLRWLPPALREALRHRAQEVRRPSQRMGYLLVGTAWLITLGVLLALVLMV